MIPPVITNKLLHFSQTGKKTVFSEFQGNNAINIVRFYIGRLIIGQQFVFK